MTSFIKFGLKVIGSAMTFYVLVILLGILWSIAKDIR